MFSPDPRNRLRFPLVLPSLSRRKKWSSLQGRQNTVACISTSSKWTSTRSRIRRPPPRRSHSCMRLKFSSSGLHARASRNDGLVTRTCLQQRVMARGQRGSTWACVGEHRSNRKSIANRIDGSNSGIELPGRAFVQKVKTRGIQVATGYGKLGDTTFRIGHMGDHTVETLKNCFAACEQAVRD